MKGYLPKVDARHMFRVSIQNQTTVTGRTMPYRERRPGTYQCDRCGIERPTRRDRATTTCRDCQDVLKGMAA